MRNEIQEGGLNQILARRLAIDNRPPAPVLGTDVFPVLVLENDRPEYKWLAACRLAGGQRSKGAVVGSYSHVGLSNPIGSGVIAVVERVSMFVGAATQDNYIAIEKDTPGAIKEDATGYATLKDPRAWASATAVVATCVPYDYANAVSTGFPISLIRCAANTTIQYDTNVVLSPGCRILVRPSAVNLSVSASFQFYERAANPGELVG